VHANGACECFASFSYAHPDPGIRVTRRVRARALNNLLCDVSFVLIIIINIIARVLLLYYVLLIIAKVLSLSRRAVRVHASRRGGAIVVLTSGRKWLTQVIVCNVSQSCCRLVGSCSHAARSRSYNFCARWSTQAGLDHGARLVGLRVVASPIVNLVLDARTPGFWPTSIHGGVKMLNSLHYAHSIFPQVFNCPTCWWLYLDEFTIVCWWTVPAVCVLTTAAVYLILCLKAMSQSHIMVWALTMHAFVLSSPFFHTQPVCCWWSWRSI